MKKNVPSIVWAKDSINPMDYDLAIQCGPVIVEPGGIMGIYENDFYRANRSVIGIADGKVVIAVVAGENNTGLSLYEFAYMLRTPQDKGGLGCDVALNLDGGFSSQVSFCYNNVVVGVDGLWRVNSAVVVRKK